MATRKGGRSRSTEDDIENPGEPKQKGLSITIPLRSFVSPELVGADKLSKAIHKEYATRLLESLGATPTKANLEMVRKYVPISKECLKVSARTTGHSKDQVEVAPPVIKYDYKVAHLGCRAKPHELITIGMMQTRAKKEEANDAEVCFARPEDLAQYEIEDDLDGVKVMEFQKIARKFLYPYNLAQKPPKPKERLAFKPEASAAPPSERRVSFKAAGHLALANLRMARMLQSQQSSRSLLKGGSNRSRTPGRGNAETPFPSTLGNPSAGAPSSTAKSKLRSQRDSILDKDRRSEGFFADLLLEIGTSFELDTEEIIAFQENYGKELVVWKNSMREGSLKDAVTDDEFLETIRMLGSKTTTHMSHSMATLMYNKFFLKEEDAKAPQVELTFKIQRDFADLCTRFRKTKADLFFTMPVLLLGLRSFVEKLFKKRFPLWDSTEEAKDIQWEMDKAVVEMLDPNGYYGELSLVQALPAATHILQRTVYGKARKKITERLYNTSPLLRFALGAASSMQARKLLQQERQAKLKLAGGFNRGEGVPREPANTTKTTLDSNHSKGSKVAHGRRTGRMRPPQPPKELDTNTTNTNTTNHLTEEQRKELFKMSLKVRESFHPASMGTSSNTEARGQWLFKSSVAGCAGL
mmetsp:Transcript_44995/g.75068  ORF Transcript_44995/g.75068 Transcript_44995/m.75068 type:complete len:639 (+) Transcript_44995:337-2253(+)|eukprot:CAMPEP_0198202304 /NCGR_PEP_ID=MMETSP1445-20131203/5443_1 /TAXON_ID=36898 /ORGANISM="Pyramimonas sp., Strain CCMP2087" /LENGTH=638 /DNA_ID=CAMNT_0043873153 /DNA_START=263 /DNA_END=2179 /DNA_ORIENTATION=+